MSRKLWLIVGVILFLGVVFGLSTKMWPDRRMGEDARLICLGGESLEMVSLSKERNMINRMKIGSEVEVWIPGGLGWYRVGSLQKLLDQEKISEKIYEIGFYNFGFLADSYVRLNESGCGNDKQYIKVMGIWNWLNFKLNSDKYLLKEEEITDLERDSQNLVEVLSRDMSDSMVLDEGVRLGVYNNSQESGLAGMLGNIFEMAGMAVVLVDSGEQEGKEVCELRYKDEVFLSSSSFKILKRGLGCVDKVDERVVEGEVEIYLNQGYAEMINYPSYR